MTVERTTTGLPNAPRSSNAGGGDPKQQLDAVTILENLVQLDQILDETSRRELGGLPYLELSKHLRIRRPG